MEKQAMTTNDEIIITGYVPGTLGRVTEMQAIYYAEVWGLPFYFEAKAAVEMAEFLGRFDPAHDGLWLARHNNHTVGAIFIDGSDAEGQGARLRWFMVEPAYHGRGLGRRLMDEAMSFCKRMGFKKVYLTTFKGLDAARHLYDKAGFKVTREEEGTHLTGKPITEQRLELVLPPNEASAASS
jgi:GNAT superfamily N-acetyltransferase